jgi:hypothetical protein
MFSQYKRPTPREYVQGLDNPNQELPHVTAARQNDPRRPSRFIEGLDGMSLNPTLSKQIAADNRRASARRAADEKRARKGDYSSVLKPKSEPQPLNLE